MNIKDYILINERLKLNKDTKNVEFTYRYRPNSKEELIKNIRSTIITSKDGILDLNSIDTYKITDFSDLFTSIILIGIHTIDMSGWRTSKVTNMNNFLLGKSELRYVIGLENWNVSSINSMKFAFASCNKLVEINSLSNWKVDECKDFYGMFAQCNSLSKIGNISSWNPSKDAVFTGMFKGCNSLTVSIGNLDSWNLNNPKNTRFMFKGVPNKLIPTWYID